MKAFVICFIFAVSLTCCLAAGKRCRSTKDCDEGQCCVARGVFGFTKGDCKDLAQLGKSCSTKETRLDFERDEYFLFCPCAPGLSCEPSEVKELPFVGTIKIDERCVEGVTTVTPEKQTDSIPEE